LISFLAASVLLVSCNEDDTINVPQREPERVGLDLSQLNSETSNGIMMQAFYWNVEPIGEWYNTILPEVKDWSESGINRIWLAPPSKGQSGGFSMGYDPCDYFDLGEFDQHGTVKTRFGSKEELIALIDEAHNNDLEVIADIVLNHNSGGQLEANPNTGADTFTKFDSPSGLFPRTFDDYYPDSEGNTDEGVFGGFADLNHNKPNVQNWLWKNENSVAKYYKSLGFDGWRFDFVKGFDPKWVKAWNDEVGGFSIGENFDGNAQVLRDWVEASGSTAFDFACFFKLDEALDRNNDLSILAANNDDMLRKTNPADAVTFTANSRKMLAYSYILTHDGYPTIFYSDYKNETFQPMLKRLMQVHNSIASGTVEILEASKDIYVMKRNGTATNPGLIYVMNIARQTREVEVATNWNNTRLFDYTRNSKEEPNTDATGNVNLTVLPNSFEVWSIAK